MKTYCPHGVWNGWVTKAEVVHFETDCRECEEMAHHPSGCMIVLDNSTGGYGGA